MRNGVRTGGGEKKAPLEKQAEENEFKGAETSCQLWQSKQRQDNRGRQGEQVGLRHSDKQRDRQIDGLCEQETPKKKKKK